MELSVRAPLEADVHEPGPRRRARAACVLDIVRRLPAAAGLARSGDGPRAADARVRRAADYSLHTYAADDFPRLPEVDHERTFGVDRDDVPRDRRAASSRAASRDESRPVLTGVLVEFAGGVLTMAATDSYRMAVRTSAARRRPAGAR